MMPSASFVVSSRTGQQCYKAEPIPKAFHATAFISAAIKAGVERNLMSGDRNSRLNYLSTSPVVLHGTFCEYSTVSPSLSHIKCF